MAIVHETTLSTEIDINPSPKGKGRMISEQTLPSSETLKTLERIPSSRRKAPQPSVDDPEQLNEANSATLSLGPYPFIVSTPSSTVGPSPPRPPRPEISADLSPPPSPHITTSSLPAEPLSTRPKHVYGSITNTTFPTRPKTPAAEDRLVADGTRSVERREEESASAGTESHSSEAATEMPVPATMEDVTSAEDLPLRSRAYRSWERRRRARQSVFPGLDPLTPPRPTSNTFLAPLARSPRPPSSSFGDSNSSAPTVHPTALSNSGDFTLSVHQSKVLYPGEAFNFILHIADYSSPIPAAVNLSFSAQAISRLVAEDGEETTTHHTLFTWSSDVPLTAQSDGTSLDLPFSVVVPVRTQCETCAARCETMPPSLHVKDHQGALVARVSYELVAIWGEKAAVAEVKVAQRREAVERAVQRGKWVKLDGETDMRGGWQGWDLERMEMAYQLPTSTSPASNILFHLQADLQLSTASSDSCAPYSPLLSLLPRLSAEHSHLILYELISGDSGPMHINRAWSSTTEQYDLDAKVEAYEELAKKGVKLRRAFNLRDIPLSTFAPFTACGGWNVEYRFELILGQLDRDACPVDHFQFSVPFIRQSSTSVDRGEAADGEAERLRWTRRTRRWLARGAMAVWKFVCCSGSV